MTPLYVIAVFLLAVSGAAAGSDLCDGAYQTLHSRPRQAVACYAGAFLTKMLTELSDGQNKTVQHVRAHLLPYLGAGHGALDALRSDSPNDPGCLVCYADPSTADALSSLRDGVSAAAREAYDALKPCYARLTERLLASLPQSACGVWLYYAAGETSVEERVAQIFVRLYKDRRFDDGSCPRARNAEE